MALGLFGKLPAKRDFVAAGMPREFLTAWEEWMQASLSASKATLAERWLASYLQAPLWRFWLGPEVCGLAATGVFMPSIDGVGRHFPLTVVQCAAPGETLAPLDGGLNESWYHQLEEFLLGCLDQSVAFETVLASLAALPETPAGAEPKGDARVSEEQGAMILHTEAPGDLAQGFETLADMLQRRLARKASFWWTVGGESFAPAAMIAQGLPNAYAFARMIAPQMPAEGA